MGTTITDWSTVEGAMYTGAGGGEWFWVLVALVLTVLPLVAGVKHELDSYKKLEK
ncbi:MAG: hypothetical protein AAFY03_02585 [Pseudomonadota bacterium]